MENLKEETKSLYERLGRPEGLTTIANDIVNLHLQNPVVSARYKQTDIINLKRLAFELLAMGSGGPETYTGRNMLDTHRGMNISEQEFMAVVDDILEALEMNHIGKNEQDEVHTILHSMRKEIIRV